MGQKEGKPGHPARLQGRACAVRLGVVLVTLLSGVPLALAAPVAPVGAVSLVGTIIAGQAVGPLGPILQWAGSSRDAVGEALKAPYIVGGFRSGPLRQLESLPDLGLKVEWLAGAKQVRVSQVLPQVLPQGPRGALAPGLSAKGSLLVDCLTTYTSIGGRRLSVEEVANTEPQVFEEMFTAAADDGSEVGQDNANDAYGQLCEAATERALLLARAPADVRKKLVDLRSALAAWEDAHYAVQSMLAGGGTLYGHMAARARASREQLMDRLAGLALGGDGVTSMPPGTGPLYTIDALKARVTQLVSRPVEDYSGESSDGTAAERAAAALEAAKYVAEVRGEFVKATNALAQLSSGLSADWATRVASYAVGKLDGMEW